MRLGVVIPGLTAVLACSFPENTCLEGTPGCGDQTMTGGAGGSDYVPDPPNDYAAAVIESAPIGYWLLDEPAGSAMVRNLVTGELDGVVTAAVELGREGIRPDGRAAGFASGPGRIRFGGAYPIDWNAMTVELWARLDEPDAPGGSRRMLSLEALTMLAEAECTDARRTGFGMSAQGGLPKFELLEDHHGCFCETGMQPQPCVVADDALPSGEFVHLAGTYDGTAFVTCVYVNGVARCLNDASRVISPPDATLSLGGISDDGVGFPGTFDELAIYDRVLSATEVQAHYQAR